MVNTSREEVVRREILVIISMFLNGQYSNLQQDASSETRVFTNSKTC